MSSVLWKSLETDQFDSQKNTIEQIPGKVLHHLYRRTREDKTEYVFESRFYFNAARSLPDYAALGAIDSQMQNNFGTIRFALARNQDQLGARWTARCLALKRLDVEFEDETEWRCAETDQRLHVSRKVQRRVVHQQNCINGACAQQPLVSSSCATWHCGVSKCFIQRGCQNNPPVKQESSLRVACSRRYLQTAIFLITGAQNVNV